MPQRAGEAGQREATVKTDDASMPVDANGCVQAGPEVCDGRDNDCDGAIDERLVQTCGSSDVEPCRKGTKTCTAGMWSECRGAIEPQSEVCDAASVDENCNGVANEGCDCAPGAKRSCGVTRGSCKQGEAVCDESGKWSSVCTGEVKPKPEVCDGQADDDCDGMSDKDDPDCECVEGETEQCVAGVGACAVGTRKCSQGMWSICRSQLQMAPEDICGDGQDNDCDGRVDEADSSCETPGYRCVDGHCVPNGDIAGALETVGGYVLTIVNGGGYGTPVDAPQTAIHTDAMSDTGPWEQFEIVWQDAAFSRFALKTADGAHYVTAVDGGGIGGPNDATCPIHTDGRSAGPWEMLTLHIRGSRVSIQTANGTYLTAQNGGGIGGPDTMPIHTDATRILSDEIFTLRR